MTWTTILRRQDGSVDFYRSWDEYKAGFGDPPLGEYFVGLDRLHKMTSRSPQELMIILRDWDGEERYASYDAFQIDSEADLYRLSNLGKYSGTAGDGMVVHKGMKFSTYDRDNDSSNKHCAHLYYGAWWFNDCYTW